MPKRSLPWSGDHETEYDEDYSPYTRVRLIMHNGRYEDELDLLRLKTAELQAQVTELDHEIDEIMNLDMEDIVSLKKDIHIYYNQYRQARLQVLELQEELSRTRDGSPEQRLPSEVNLWRTELPDSQGQIRLDIRSSHLQNSREVASAVSDVHQHCESSEGEPFVPSIVSKVGDSSSHHVQSASLVTPSITNSSSGHAQNSVTVTDHETTSPANNDEISAPQTLPYPSDAPSFGWFYDAYIYLNVDLGSRYLKLLCRWVEHERKNQWICPNDYREGFGKFRRPSLCNKWIRNRRYYRFQADVDKEGCSTTKFSSEVWDWWSTLQPKCEPVTEGGISTAVDGSEVVLNPLNKHGKHGWPVLLACVKWWAVGLQHYFDDDREEQKGKWDALVEDMIKTLEGL
ncbi:uncharacterized protein C8R40DRAFT_1173184 [Lentinula edodes]|uniref:uncharacterized protein n=1 Tax=Lentinula edodes TaxID=5353 RepID=UPI001E8EB389|nr:uncharacterized protein C8R40DRAFT_1173184 [Lentinula edodes]KAH7872788.1 hypothetical protein C8R40DRAFT_1173184 [Lentinula edodes]